MATRAATPAGRRRSTARTKRGSGRAKRAAPKANAVAKPRRARPAPKRRAKRAAPKRQAKRAAPKRRAQRKTKARRFTRPKILSLRGGAVILALAGTLTAGYFLWLRDSSLVAVTEVEVEGVSGPDREQITVALRRAARDMTTLHVRPEHLREAVSSFPTVETVRADAGFPHSLRIEVIERPPTLVVSAGDREVPVAADGTVLPGTDAPDSAPRLGVDQIPSAGRLQGEVLDQALIVGAAPEELRELIEQLSYTEEAGVLLHLAGQVELRFGSGARAEAKWLAAATVLADPKLESLTYVDVRVPERPAAGGSAPTSTPAAPETATEMDSVTSESLLSTGG